MSTWKHLKYVATFPKIGPDMYMTHWLLFFKPLRIWFQKRCLKNRIGDNSEIRPYSILDGYQNIVIGKNVIIPEGVRLVTDPTDSDARIIIEDDVLFGPNVAVYCTTHLIDDLDLAIKYQPLLNKTTKIGAGSWIGINAVIAPGVTIGRHAVVGANSYVNKDVADYTVVAGSPARFIKSIV